MMIKIIRRRNLKILRRTAKEEILLVISREVYHLLLRSSNHLAVVQIRLL
jgi:hypothetical protein